MKHATLLKAALIWTSFLVASMMLSHANAETLPPGPYKCTPRDFKKAAVSALVKAQANGWQGVGDLSLEEAKQQILKSDAKVDCTDKKVNITDGRWSGRFDTSKKTIQARPDNFEPAPEEIQEAFALHEYVQVEGHRDLNYDYSMRVQQMGKRKFDPKSPLNDNPKVLHKFPKGNAFKKAGGSTGVGGGGDTFDYYIRRMMIEGLMEGIENAKLTDEGRVRAHDMLNIAMTVDLHFLLDPIGVMQEPTIVRTTYKSFEDGDGALGISVGRGYLYLHEHQAIMGIFTQLGNIMNIHHAEQLKADGKGDGIPEVFGEAQWNADGTAAQATIKPRK